MMTKRMRRRRATTHIVTTNKSRMMITMRRPPPTVVRRQPRRPSRQRHRRAAVTHQTVHLPPSQHVRVVSFVPISAVVGARVGRDGSNSYSRVYSFYFSFVVFLRTHTSSVGLSRRMLYFLLFCVASNIARVRRTLFLPVHVRFGFDFVRPIVFSSCFKSNILCVL